MTDPTPLSPAAQAVLTAATQRLYCLDPEDVPTSASEHGCAIAAALRAAADQYGIYDDGEGLVSAVRVEELLAIAAELEGLQ